MSDMVDVINRLEAWIRNYGHEKQPAFIADLRALIGTAKAAQRAAELLQGAKRYSLEHDDTGIIMEPCTCGDLILIDDVVKAMQILQGECSE